jgi:lactate permease
MWEQTYTPVGGSLGLSVLAAAIPIFTLLVLLGVLRKPAWMASLAGLGAAAVVAMAVRHAVGPRGGRHTRRGLRLFPIGWVVLPPFCSIDHAGKRKPRC